MSEPQTLEEAWADMRFHGEMSFRKGCPQCVAAADRVRALLLLGLEEARDYHLNDCDGCKPDDPCGYHYMQRRIEALGK